MLSANERVKVGEFQVRRLIQNPTIVSAMTGHFALLGEPNDTFLIFYPREDSSIRPSEDIFLYTLSGPLISSNEVMYKFMEKKKNGNEYTISFYTSGDKYIDLIVSLDQGSGLRRSPTLPADHIVFHMKKFLENL